jgi:hypothetical protein
MHFRGLEGGSFVFNVVHFERAECEELRKLRENGDRVKSHNV